MNEYYIPGYLLDTSDKSQITGLLAWQHIKDGVQVGFATEQVPDLTPPKVHEFIPTSIDPHFAPGVLQDPASKAYVPPTMGELLAAFAADKANGNTEQQDAITAKAKAAIEAATLAKV